MQNANTYHEYVLQDGKIYVNGPHYLITEADVPTFLVATKAAGDFAKDRNHVYWIGGVLDDVDPQIFTPLYTPKGNQTGYGKDNQHVYFFWGKDPPYLVDGADAITFEALDSLPNPDGSECPDAKDNIRNYCGGTSMQ